GAEFGAAAPLAPGADRARRVRRPLRRRRPGTAHRLRQPTGGLHRAGVPGSQSGRAIHRIVDGAGRLNRPFRLRPPLSSVATKWRRSWISNAMVFLESRNGTIVGLEVLGASTILRADLLAQADERQPAFRL